MKKSELKPCPHCGYSAKLIKDEGAYKVFCLNPACDAQYGWCGTAEQAVNGWNHRKDGEKDNNIGRGKAIWLINSDGYYPYCSACMTEPKDGIMTDFCPSCGAKMEGKIT